MKKNIIFFVFFIITKNTYSEEKKLHCENCSCQKSIITKYVDDIKKYITDKEESIKDNGKKVAAKVINKTVDGVNSAKKTASSVIEYIEIMVSDIINWAKNNS